MFDLTATRNAVKETEKLLKEAKEALKKNPSNLNLKIALNQADNNYRYAVQQLMNKTESNSEILRDAALHYAITQIGQKEATGHNDGKIIELYQEHQTWLKNEPWCCSFVSYCFLVASQQLKIQRPFPQAFRVNDFVKLAKEKGWWIGRKSTPFAGDCFVIYHPEDANKSHIGFVRENGITTIKTIEGNYQNQVYSRQNLSKALIGGYIRVKTS